ncbi:tyrosine--tRNA ligase [Bartonella sp. DGB1]|uniref:tyrosine--tRNA ligase n=1 Tax=Bartonella sp. DGB1 TaxID=3239807 RepID=UPI0035251D0E
MHKYKSDFLQILQERGFIHQISLDDELDNLLKTQTVSAYIGFDPTASSLHVGSMIQIMMLYWLQQTGHKPFILMGGATGLIGDPSFKDEARVLLDKQVVENNINSIKGIFNKYLDFETQSNSAVIVNNADWLNNINYLEFLRDIGKYFSINRMLSFDSVKSRLDRESSLSFLEFNYMILQGYDFVQLSKNYGVRLQMGGSDQWGNIINGIELAHKLKMPQLYALTSPLLTTASGQKMGKSVSGAIWLDANMLSPYEFWQFWRNTEDADVGRFLRLYTILPMDEIRKLEKIQGKEINEVKKILATQVTSLLHGKEQAEQAEKTSLQTFELGQIGDNLPTLIITEEELKNGIGILSLLVKANLSSSNSEARRNIRAGGVKLNDIVINDEAYIVTIDHLIEGKIKLSFGRKKHVIIHY